MKLTNNDYKKIASQIEVGEGNIQYDLDDVVLSIDYTFERSGYVEDDCYNGTGAFVEKERNLRIEKAEAYDENGRATPIYVDERILNSYIA